MNYLTLYPCEILVEICRFLTIDKIYELTSTINNSLVRKNGLFWTSLWFQRTGLICSKEFDFVHMNSAFNTDYCDYLGLIKDINEMSSKRRGKYFHEFVRFFSYASYNDANSLFDHLLKYIEYQNNNLRLEDSIALTREEWGELLVGAAKIGSVDLIDKILLSSEIDKKYYVQAMGITGGKSLYNSKTQEYYLFQFNHLLSHLTKQGVILRHNDYFELMYHLVSNANIMLISHGLNHLYSLFSEREIDRFIARTLMKPDDLEILKYLYDFFGPLSTDNYMDHMFQTIFYDQIEKFDLIMLVCERNPSPIKFSEKNYNDLIMRACGYGSLKIFERLMSLVNHPLSVETYREIIVTTMVNNNGYENKIIVKNFEEILSLCHYTFTKEDYLYVLKDSDSMWNDTIVNHIREKLKPME